MKDMTFSVMKDNKKHEYEIVKFFKNPNNNNDYIVYHEKNDDELFASKYVIKNNELVLLDIETDEEWEYIDGILGE